MKKTIRRPRRQSTATVAKRLYGPVKGRIRGATVADLRVQLDIAVRQRDDAIRRLNQRANLKQTVEAYDEAFRTLNMDLTRTITRVKRLLSGVLGALVSDMEG